jgi:RNA polymerase sigma-70 factor, ECF subfamily
MLYIVIHMRRDRMLDNELLAALKEGRTEAFQQVVESQKHTVLNICFRFVQNREDAEELAQETFVEVYRSVSRFRGDATLTTWIHRIAVSKSLSFIRQQNRQRRGGSQRQRLHVSIDTVNPPSDRQADPHEILERQERQLALERAIDSLPSNQRVALTLSRYDGISHREIAAVLNVSVPAVEALLHRARTTLKKRLCKFYKENLP